MDRKKALIRQLEGFARSISPQYKLKKMFLFGSQAWGKPHRDSDIDLLVVSEQFKGVKRLERAPDLYLKWDLNYPVDFICLTPDEFKRKKKQIGIVQQVLKEGLQIL